MCVRSHARSHCAAADCVAPPHLPTPPPPPPPARTAQVGVFPLLLVWMLFLLHLVEGTTNDYFCTSLQLAVAILQLTPNVAGVTFLAVGNAACDVIASVAAFATGVPKVGVGTTVGAGIFVTCAVVAAVTFVSDVRLARRSFVRDISFFILSVLYLLLTTLDGVITLAESVGESPGGAARERWARPPRRRSAPAGWAHPQRPCGRRAPPPRSHAPAPRSLSAGPVTIESPWAACAPPRTRAAACRVHCDLHRVCRRRRGRAVAAIPATRRRRC